MKPGTRCARCGRPFQDDEPLSAYSGTITILISKSQQKTEYDLCAICLANQISELQLIYTEESE